mgnify:CR=1 FL=1
MKNSSKAGLPGDDVASPTVEETPEARVRRMYAAEGGPLLAWLQEEAASRGHRMQDMAQALGVTSGYIHQLKSGLRRVEHISAEFAASCARYLGVPTVVVKIISGKITMNDFLWPHQDEEVLVNRAFSRMIENPAGKLRLSPAAGSHSLEVKKALVAMYAEVTGEDLFGLYELPDVVRLLLRATAEHNDAEVEKMTA